MLKNKANRSKKFNKGSTNNTVQEDEPVKISLIEPSSNDDLLP